ncbi:MAG: hypothetical protein FJW21_14020 [Acidimicrobiia bacterium]|nr:hypothetical protein [Acidimicrobiia bacterium]
MSWPVVGHARIADVLTKSVSAGRVPQTLLFAGPAGIGKFATAIALAQAVNCGTSEPRNPGTPCRRCSTCERIARRQFSDVIVVEKGDYASISIKVVREKILALIGYRPFEGQKRVFIVDGADDLTWEAQDSLLKTLEEPPPAAILILIATSPDVMKATVLSRCRRLRFGTLSDEEVARVLQDTMGMDAASARSRAAIAGGSVGQALAIDGGTLEEDRDLALAFLQAAASPNLGSRLKAAAALTVHEKKRRSREAVATRLAHLSALLRDLAVTDTGNAALARAFPPDRLIPAFSTVARAQSALDRNASPKVVADWIAASL